ncbi:uncharacterized protein LOC130802366 [Amaranthus tricolor]|uniref:uncharacterized protein LOC130802366 n=1 Tax=Amaranthus tricolor TaxID=29722 RepID=UPI00258BABB7|nr:uncharacterized protein LOC130802366 [Amaranthus tricolor]XP_057522325.1 uncharacterized protein LOC130802366 [Amaranthus tricolor]XP_057522326.1 uncharacterized protein LOC130802366 [Amaranthus tricolor]
MALKRDEAEVTPGVVTGTFLVNNKPAYVLFDSGAFHSLIASSCISKLSLSSSLEISSEFAQPSGERILCQRVYRDIPLDFMGIDLRVDLIEFPLDNFDVILGMDWLRKYKEIIDCWLKKVSVRGSKGQRVTFKGFVPKNHTKIISVIKLKTYSRRN